MKIKPLLLLAGLISNIILAFAAMLYGIYTSLQSPELTELERLANKPGILAIFCICTAGALLFKKGIENYTADE